MRTGYKLNGVNENNLPLELWVENLIEETLGIKPKTNKSRIRPNIHVNIPSDLGIRH